MKRLMTICAVAAVMLTIGSVRGDIVFTSYPDISDPANYGVWNNTSPNPEIVESFITGTNALGGWDLTQITLNAYGGGIMGGGSSPANITIYADNGGNVGASINSWSVAIDSSMGGDFIFAVSGVELQIDTVYWFGVEATGNNAVGWRRTDSYGQPDAAGHVFEITGTAIVPEPATLVLLGLGGLLCRKFKRT